VSDVRPAQISASCFLLSLGSAWADVRYVDAASTVLSNCVLSGNSATNGGGGFGGGAYGGNSARDGLGGGAYNCTLNNCTLTGNTADYGGGAYGNEDSPCRLYNCTAVDNLAYDSGGGVARSKLANCVVAYNAAWTDPNSSSRSS
jgi:hypothetical protein